MKPKSGVYEVKNNFGKVIYRGSCNEVYVQRQYPSYSYSYECIKPDIIGKDEYKQWRR